MRQQAIQYLNKNAIQNMPALEALSRGAVVSICQSGGVIIHDTKRKMYFVSADDNALIDGDWWHADQGTEVLALREQNIRPIVHRIAATDVMLCRQAVFLGDIPMCTHVEGLSIAPLCEGDIDFVMVHYTMGLERDYILERLRAGEMYGAFYRGKPAGFIGRHYDGSVGLLEVLPQFRRLGIGTALACFMIGRVRARGETPYAHILMDNAPSLALLSRMEGV